MGEVVEVGPEAKSRKVGDRVVVPFTRTPRSAAAALKANKRGKR